MYSKPDVFTTGNWVTVNLILTSALSSLFMHYCVNNDHLWSVKSGSFLNMTNYTWYIYQFPSKILVFFPISHFHYCCSFFPPIFTAAIIRLKKRWKSQGNVQIWLSIYSLFFIISLHFIPNNTCPVSWGCRIHQLHLCRGVKTPAQQASWIWH